MNTLKYQGGQKAYERISEHITNNMGADELTDFFLSEKSMILDRTRQGSTFDQKIKSTLGVQNQEQIHALEEELGVRELQEEEIREQIENVLNEFKIDTKIPGDVFYESFGQDIKEPPIDQEKQFLHRPKV